MTRERNEDGMTDIERFAMEYRLRVTRDSCNDPIIAGRRGHLYFDAGELCLMVTDGKPANHSSWAAIGGELWLGDISPNAKGQRVQDVKITGIPLENAGAAIRMVRARPKRVLSSEELELRRAIVLKARESLSKRQLRSHLSEPTASALVPDSPPLLNQPKARVQKKNREHHEPNDSLSAL
jgi:hypothetical protein